jgi:hypothetical protein
MADDPSALCYNQPTQNKSNKAVREKTIFRKETRMKKQIALLISVVVLPFVFAENARPQNAFSCGMEQSMERMPRSLKESVEASATSFRANELLLYINFNNPNGTLVFPGFGDAETMRSPIVNQVRFCPPPSLTQAQKDEIVRLVQDDFSPFNIRVTTDSAEFLAYPRPLKEMCLITTIPQVIGRPAGTGGVAPFAGLGRRLANNFAFAFSDTVGNDPSDVAAIISHESGHLLGLGHQHQFNPACNFVDEYHAGFGIGPLAFDPLMGAAFTSGINNWFAQSCPSPIFGPPQDDYNLINDQVEVRTDDFPNIAEGPVHPAESFEGRLESAGDVDFIRINFRSPGPVTISSDNIDLKVTLLNPGGRIIGEFNDPDTRNVTIPSANGMRFLKIEAAGNENMEAQFMTGTYRVLF